jgi:diacylglycerol O-acyltransferase / wax synthase
MTRVTGMDVMFLYGGSANWPFYVGVLTLLDPSGAPGGFGPGKLRTLFKERLVLAPQFRWRVRDVALGFDHPVFVEDEHFDVDHHFHHVDLARPGTQRQLAELAGRLLTRPLDRSRPLWDMWLIGGLEDGRFALLTRIHHAVVDGMSGADLAGLIMDVEPAPAPREAATLMPPEPPPSLAGSVAGAIGHAILSPVRTARYAVQFAQQAAILGRHMLRGTAAGLPFFTARSRLNGALTPRRVVCFASVPLAEVLRVKDAFGVTVNDVVLGLVGEALRSWLADRGELPGRALVAEVPVSIRTAATRHDVGSRVANSFVSLATDIGDPVERLRAIHRSSQDAKAMQRDFAACKRVNLSDVPVPGLLGLAVRAFAATGLDARIPPIYSAIVSSIPGPTIDFYMAGAKVNAIYPMGPLMYASGLTVTALTLGDQIHFGLVTCPDVVPDGWAIADRLQDALAQLTGAIPTARDKPIATGA